MSKNTLIFRSAVNISFNVALSLLITLNFSLLRAMDLREDTLKISHHGIAIPDDFLNEVQHQEYTAYKTQSIKVDSVFKDFIIPEGSHIFDIGCGDGKVTKEIFLLTKAMKVVGVDPDKDKIAQAKEVYATIPNLEFYEKSIENISEEYIYDVATSFGTLHWLSQENKKIAFQNISNCLKNGGIFIATLVTESRRTRLNTAVHEVMKQGAWENNFRVYTDPIHIEKPSFIKEILKSCRFQINNFEYVEAKREFPNNKTFHDWINSWSTYKKYLTEKTQHDNFWWDVIYRYRELTNQSTEEKVLFTEYYVRLYAVKL